MAEEVLEEVGHAQRAPVPFVEGHSAEMMFCHKVIRLLQGEGLLSQERAGLMLSRRHTGSSVHNRMRVEPEDQATVERPTRYILRPPIGFLSKPLGSGALLTMVRSVGCRPPSLTDTAKG